MIIVCKFIGRCIGYFLFGSFIFYSFILYLEYCGVDMRIIHPQYFGVSNKELLLFVVALMLLDHAIYGWGNFYSFFKGVYNDN